MTQATKSPDVAEALGSRPPLGGRVLVATRGDEASDAALAIAGRLVERDGGALHALAVVDRLPAYAVGLAEIAVADVEAERRAATAHALRRQVERVGEGAQWTWTLVTGDPAERIVGVAAAERSTLVVLGLEHHGPVERVLGGETALHVIRNAKVPVLAAPPGAVFPRRALVAVDFSATSVAAARLATMLLDSNGSLTLAHVQPFVPVRTEDRVSWGELYAEGARRRLTELRDHLEDGWRGHTDTELLTGDPSNALLEYARTGGYDVLAIGSHAQGAIERLLVGSVSTHLVRGARCALLVAPPA